MTFYIILVTFNDVIRFTFTTKKYYTSTRLLAIFLYHPFCGLYHNTTLSGPATPPFHGDSGPPYSTHKQNTSTFSFHDGQHYLITLNNNSLGSSKLVWHQVYCINKKY